MAGVACSCQAGHGGIASGGRVVDHVRSLDEEGPATGEVAGPCRMDGMSCAAEAQRSNAGGLREVATMVCAQASWQARFGAELAETKKLSAYTSEFHQGVRCAKLRNRDTRLGWPMAVTVILRLHPKGAVAPRKKTSGRQNKRMVLCVRAGAILFCWGSSVATRGDCLMYAPSPSPTPTAIAAATAAIGGAVVPLPLALQGLGWPYLSRSAIHARRIAGTLPVRPKRLGGRWVVYARDVARLFEVDPLQTDESPPAPPPRRGPGRPRKLASTSIHNEPFPPAGHPPYTDGGEP